MTALLLTIHILVCAAIILVVLIQSGKGAGLSGLFSGGGGGDALFSAPSGSQFMRKLTAGLAGAFFLTTILLTYLAAHRGSRTVTQNVWGGAPAAAPAEPAAAPAEAAPPAGEPVKK